MPMLKVLRPLHCETTTLRCERVPRREGVRRANRIERYKSTIFFLHGKIFCETLLLLRIFILQKV